MLGVLRLIGAGELPSTGMNTQVNATVLATFASKSNPSKSHQVRQGADGNIYCTCPSWRFQHNSPSNRSCKHIVAHLSRTVRSFDPSQEPVAIRPVRSSRKAAPVVSAPEYRPTSWERL